MEQKYRERLNHQFVLWRGYGSLTMDTTTLSQVIDHIFMGNFDQAVQELQGFRKQMEDPTGGLTCVGYQLLFEQYHQRFIEKYGFSWDVWMSVEAMRACLEEPNHGVDENFILRRFQEHIQTHPQATTAAVHLQRVANYIQHHLEQDLSLCQLAQVAGISEGHLSRLMHQTWGIGVRGYIQQQRLRQVKVWLETTDDRIDTIARRLRFPNSSYLARQFKKTYGWTPNQYRQYHRWKE